MPTLCALCRMLSSDIKPLKAGLQEKTQSSLILCVTWHLFGAAFSVAQCVERNTDRESLVAQFKSKWLHEDDPLAVIQSTLDLLAAHANTQIYSGIHADPNSYVCKD